MAPAKYRSVVSERSRKRNIQFAVVCVFDVIVVVVVVVAAVVDSFVIYFWVFVGARHSVINGTGGRRVQTSLPMLSMPNINRQLMRIYLLNCSKKLLNTLKVRRTLLLTTSLLNNVGSHSL